MTANDDPPSARGDGVASVGRVGVPIFRRVEAQRASLIVPRCPAAVADVSVNLTRSNVANGSSVHVTKHIAGALTIHSAESVP